MRQSNGRPAIWAGFAAAIALATGARGEGDRVPAVFRTCSDHFVPRATPRIDVTRLGLSCGPVTGMTRHGRVNGTVDEDGPPVRLEWKAEKNDCFRIFGVAAAPVDDLEVEITGPHGARVSLTNESRRFVVAGEEAPFCALEAGDYQARFTTHGGRGALSAAVYRGAKMRDPHAPSPP